MNELQAKELEILKFFIKICEKHHLTYFLIAGTALGAVRHKGFIPWDDDIDVALPREDYDKLMTLTSEFEGTNYFLQNYNTDPKYIYNYAKIRDNTTTYIENYYKTYQINHGVWIDIFPFDGVSYKLEDRKKFHKKVKGSWGQVWLQYPYGLRRSFSKETWFKDLLLNIVAYPWFWTNVNHYRNKLIDKKVSKIPYKDALLVGNFFGIYGYKEIFPREVFLEGQKGEFEGIEVNLPKDYDKYLTMMYGDYMKLPPEEKRVGHHYHSGFSLTKGYKEFIKERKM